MSPFRLAWANLLHQKIRTLISLFGVAFAVILIFMQLGFLGAVEQTATQFYDHLDFDLMLVSTEYTDLNRCGSIPVARVTQVQGLEGVDQATPLKFQFGIWKDPRSAESRGRDPIRPDLPPRRWSIMIVGVEPANLPKLFARPTETVFRSPEELADYQGELGRHFTVIMDRQSRPEFGKAEKGKTTELNSMKVEIVGDFDLGTGFGYNGLIVTNMETFNFLSPLPNGTCSIGLVKLKPGADPVAVQRAIEAMTPRYDVTRVADPNDPTAPPDRDVKVYTRDEICTKEQDFWVQATAVGKFFYMGVVVAMFVGVVFVYQMMASEIRNRLPEYATIKALGYSGSFVIQSVLSQAVMLAVLGFIPGLIATYGFYEMTRRAAFLPIGMTTMRMISVLALAIGMCLVSGLLALRKVQTADPADLF